MGIIIDEASDDDAKSLEEGCDDEDDGNADDDTCSDDDDSADDDAVDALDDASSELDPSLLDETGTNDDDASMMLLLEGTLVDELMGTDVEDDSAWDDDGSTALDDEDGRDVDDDRMEADDDSTLVDVLESVDAELLEAGCGSVSTHTPRAVSHTVPSLQSTSDAQGNDSAGERIERHPWPLMTTRNAGSSARMIIRPSVRASPPEQAGQPPRPRPPEH